MSKSGRIITICGVLLLALAVGLAAFNIYDSDRAGAAAQDTAKLLTEYIEEKDPVDTDDMGMINTSTVPEMPELEIDGQGYIGVLDIPELNLSLSVSAHWSYSALNVSPCRYSGSAYEKNMVICAHNYLTHFGRLGELGEGEQATFTDCDGNRFVYRLAERETVQPTGVERMTDTSYPLTLFTCNWNGTERVTLRFELI